MAMMKSTLMTMTILSFTSMMLMVLERAAGQDAFTNEILYSPEEGKSFVELVGSARDINTETMTVWVTLYNSGAYDIVWLAPVALHRVTGGTKLIGGEQERIPHQGALYVYDKPEGELGDLIHKLCYGFGPEGPPSRLLCNAEESTGGDITGHENTTTHYRRVDANSGEGASLWKESDFKWIVENSDTGSFLSTNEGQKFVVPSRASTIGAVMGFSLLAATVTSLLNV